MKPAFPSPQDRSGDELLWWVARATSGLVGDAFFRALARHMGEGLGLTTVFITECMDSPPTRVRTLAAWRDSGVDQDVEYELAGTPCADTILGERECWVPEGLQERYPRESVDPRRDSYYGVPLFDVGRSRVIGHIAFFDSKRVAREVFANPLFHIFVERAAAELQRRHAQARADEHLRQLAHASRVAAMGEMASVLAHEINQPLATILTSTQSCLRLLDRLPGVTPELLDAMRSVAKEAERAAAVVRHVRGFVRDGTPSVAEVDLNAVVEGALDLARLEARRDGVRVEFAAAPALPRVGIAAVQLEQVILNLVRNACEAMRAATGPRDVLVRTAALPRNWVEVSVQDSGPGIAPELCATVFEPFRSTRPDGLGMGLAICRSIIERHGGRLWLDGGEAAAGATFRFHLPPVEDMA